MPAGDFELRLVVYDLETQAATVEIGVWEAETNPGRACVWRMFSDGKADLPHCWRQRTIFADASARAG